jgi:hypothetical protein
MWLPLATIPDWGDRSTRYSVGKAPGVKMKLSDGYELDGFVAGAPASTPSMTSGADAAEQGQVDLEVRQAKEAATDATQR